MITFVAFCPHPPIIIDDVGSWQDLRRVKKTIAALEQVADELYASHPETIVLISPHAPLLSDAFFINNSPQLCGNLNNFGSAVNMIFPNNLELGAAIAAAAKKINLATVTADNELDHGALVPLSFLTKNFSASRPKLVHLGFSFLDFKTHFHYGEIIGEVCEKSASKIALIASGDLSHRLTSSAPAGYSPTGQKFDKKLQELLKTKQNILNLNPDFVEEAGECGFRSLLIALGALKNNLAYDQRSYEGPFGVGYLTARLR